MATTSKQYKQLGEDLWKTRDKMNTEIFTLTYGALVVQLIKDYEDYAEVNKQLDKMGYNIGTRLIEDFLSRTTLPRCTDFSTQTSEILAKVGFKSFLNITPTVVQYPASAAGEGTGSGREFGLVLEENPLSEMVELPAEALEGGLWFSQVLCGVVRGALEMVQLQVEVFFVSDVLRGDDTTEMRVRLVRFMDEEVPISDE
ncbi:NO signaling/Golgi transport ligand-binding domain-containing protein [Mrakia frigida]|uniref:TRAPP complex core subunit BET3 n=1 Tax=Mrakia frigida TaxID=29902 RepID=UPI003FCBFEBA